MEIDIFKYVDDAEIREAVLSGLAGYARDNAERVISNAGYHLATDIANTHLGDDAPEQIAKKCTEVINGLSSHVLFDLGGYGRPQSQARNLLDAAVRQQTDELKKAVSAAIHNLSKREVIEIIKSGKVKMVIE